MSTNYRRSTHRARRYRGERTIGGTLVYAGDALLNKHLFVHPVSPGGFDWGPDADDDRACQLAIALLAPTFGLEVAVDDYHLFATNFVKHELTGDTWTVRSQDLKADGLRTKFAHREYPENTAPSPSDVDIETADIDGLTYAEEIALARRYDDVLWKKGNRRGNLRRLQEIRTGALDPADESVSKQWTWLRDSRPVCSRTAETHQILRNSTAPSARVSRYGLVPIYPPQGSETMTTR